MIVYIVVVVKVVVVLVVLADLAAGVDDVDVDADETESERWSFSSCVLDCRVAWSGDRAHTQKACGESVKSCERRNRNKTVSKATLHSVSVLRVFFFFSRRKLATGRERSH